MGNPLPNENAKIRPIAAREQCCKRQNVHNHSVVSASAENRKRDFCERSQYQCPLGSQASGRIRRTIIALTHAGHLATSITSRSLWNDLVMFVAVEFSCSGLRDERKYLRKRICML